MKLILENSTNVCVFVFGDDVLISREDDQVLVGDPLILSIGDLNKSNCYVVEDVSTLPNDWTGRKYIYSEGNWTANPNYEAPMPPPSAPTVNS